VTVTLRALRHRNFSLFLSGQVCALIGYWMQQIAVSWFVYRLTGSATMLGVLSFAANLPVLVLAPIVGLIADRFNRHRLMVATQVFEMLQAVAMTVLAYSGLIETWHIIALTMFLGVCISFEVPVRHAYLLELVEDKADLPNAVALTSLVTNCGRLIGPSLAGLLISVFSEATCFLINSLTYIAVLASFAFIRVSPQQHNETHPHPVRGLAQGLHYAWRSLPIRYLLAMMAVMALTAAPYATLMPALVREAFSGRAETLGFLMSAAGMGALAGTLLLLARRGVRGLTGFIAAAALLAGVALIAMSWSRLLVPSLALMALIGFGLLVISVSVNMILQSIVEDDKRGRVMSLYTMSYLGLVPFGGLIAGMAADRIGAMHTLLAGGIACVVAALYMRHKLPQINARMRPVDAGSG
jgi:MFS family permease